MALPTYGTMAVDWENASVQYQNLSSLCCYRGDLAKGLHATGQALDLARRAARLQYRTSSLLMERNTCRRLCARFGRCPLVEEYQ